MSQTHTQIHVLDARRRTGQPFRAAVSLHCHTQLSREVLDFIPYYAARIPVVASCFKKEMARYEAQGGKPISFANAYWTPPMSPNRVVELEANQIETRLGAKALVSLTDHDSIDACVRLRALAADQDLPISLEWTLPFGGGFFHLGVHNLPPERAASIMAELALITARKSDSRLEDVLAALNDYPEVLLVLNHPIWDIERAGKETHTAMLVSFLTKYGRWIHALEINGFRSWRENSITMRIANELGYPLLSGGDRHGCSPNTVLNLTNAASFAEFVAEVRQDRLSEIVLMPEYREHVAARTLEAAAEILRSYPDFPEGRQYWTDRVFFESEDGMTRPLSYYWKKGGPFWIKSALGILSMLGSPRFRPALRLAFAGEELAL